MREKLTKKIEFIVGERDKNQEFADNFYFNHENTLKRINLYLNSRFMERKDGIFWNISNQRVSHFAKNLDLDTKDLMPYGIGETNYAQAWVLGKKLRRWLDEEKMAIKLNDLMETVSAYGSAVWKVVDNNLELVDLKNLYFNPLAKKIRETDIIEKHYLTERELKDKKEVWDEAGIDEIIDDKECKEKDQWEIWEFFGYDDDKYKRIVGFGEGEDAVILYEEEMDKEDCPYWDFHISKYEGRWLRVGVVERLFPLQERMNQLVNQNAQSTEIASLLLFRSASGDTMGNALEGAMNGQIINSADLEQIGISNTGLNQFINELQVIEQHADRICFTPEVMTGEALPSGTPFRSLAALTNAARTVFKMIRERVGETISFILKEKILPDVIKGWNRGDLLDLTEDDSDIEVFDNAIKNKILKDTILNGQVVTPEFIKNLDPIIEETLTKEGRKLEIPKGFFNFKYGIKFNITGEAYDKAQQNAAMEGALQMVMANPAILNVPLMKQYLQDNGIPYWKLSPEQMEEMAEQAQAMGGEGQVPTPDRTPDKLMSTIKDSPSAD